MGKNEISFASLIGSRICHDLISPIGAINNGLELLSMAGSVPGAEMDLIGQSVGSASARIRFFRIAFGDAGDQMVGRAETVSILRDLHAHSKLAVEWAPLEPQARRDVRLAFLSLMCLESAMPYGGRLRVSEHEGKWTLTGLADKLNVDADLWAVLANKTVPKGLRPAHVQFALLPVMAIDHERRVTSRCTQTEVEIAF